MLAITFQGRYLVADLVLRQQYSLLFGHCLFASPYPWGEIPHPPKGGWGHVNDTARSTIQKHMHQRNCPQSLQEPLIYVLFCSNSYRYHVSYAEIERRLADAHV